MGITNFPNGISSFGNPVLPANVPIMGNTGKAFFVDPARGSDSNKGTSWDKPLATVSAAYALTTDKAGDVVYLLNDGNTSGTSREDATITWSNDNTHLVGLCAPSLMSQRSRISPTTTLGSIVTPQLTVSGNGCLFENISFFEGDDEDGQASTCISVTGSRNVFRNVAMMNMGDAATGNSGDEAASTHLTITGGGENVFENCYIGLDTAARTAANASVSIASGSTRNVFKNCFFPMFADADAPLFLSVGSGGIDRFVLFDNCIFHNAVNSTATSGTAAFSINASAGGTVLVKDCMLVGMADWTSGDTTVVQLIGHTYEAAAGQKNIGIGAGVDVA